MLITLTTGTSYDLTTDRANTLSRYIPRLRRDNRLAELNTIAAQVEAAGLISFNTYYDIYKKAKPNQPNAIRIKTTYYAADHRKNTRRAIRFIFANNQFYRIRIANKPHPDLYTLLEIYFHERQTHDHNSDIGTTLRAIINKLEPDTCNEIDAELTARLVPHRNGKIQRRIVAIRDEINNPLQLNQRVQKLHQYVCDIRSNQDAPNQQQNALSLDEVRQAVSLLHQHHFYESAAKLGTMFDASTYLHLPVGLSDQRHPNLTISMIPYSSCGDIYHIIVYLLLSQYYRHVMPSVQLTWNNATNKNNAERSLAFAQSVSGLVPYFKPLENIQAKCNQPVAKQARLEEWFADNGGAHYIDQKMLTFLTANCYRHDFEATAKIVRVGFQAVKLTELQSTAITAYTQQKISAITGYHPNQPVVILHIRKTKKGGTNDKLNIDNVSGQDFMTQVRRWLNKKGVFTYTVYADNQQAETTASASPFYKASRTGHSNIGMQFHVQFLLGLYRHFTCNGSQPRVLGNTSGTLDIVAMLGFWVLDIHPKLDKLDYQAARLCKQEAFMTVYFFSKTKEERKQIRARLASKVTPKHIVLGLTEKERKNKKRASYGDLPQQFIYSISREAAGKNAAFKENERVHPKRDYITLIST